MIFKTTLFQALAGADVAQCNGQRVVAKLLDSGTPIAPFVDLADGTSLAIEDVEIAIDADGRAYTDHGKAQAAVWRFLALQPLTAATLHAQPAPAPRVGAVISRLRQIDASERRQYG